MIVLPDYRFDGTIFERSKTIIHRGRRVKDDLPVIAKSLKNPYPSESERGLLEYEYKILKELDFPGIPKVHDFSDSPPHAIVMEDFPGDSLETLFRAGTLDMKRLLDVAAEVAGLLGKIHARRIIHKNISPEHILVHRKTGKVGLIGFGIAVKTRKETPLPAVPGIQTGAPAYISPEQTGRMNRSVDYRTDFYSLGATLYEMLTGGPPFDPADPSEIIHALLTKAPTPPEKAAPNVPPPVSSVVMKLLAKAPEDRYQSSAALVRDLLECRFDRDPGAPPFEIARNDLPEQFHPPEKLYGRKEEISLLFKEFKRVTQGDTRMLLIHGPAGIGKTFLIQEIHKPLVRRKGFFLSGKFDPFKQDTPYAPMIHAFQGMIRRILTAPPAEFQMWKQKLLTALSPNAQVIVNLIPELSLIVGEQPPLPFLGLSETLNRFNRTFGKFIQVFASFEHPLVLFIDDWQWADASTLGLLKTLMNDTSIRHLLFIGVYRDTEVTATHPFQLLLDDIRKGRKTEFTTLAVPPLAPAHVAHFVRDALHCDPKAAGPLASLVHQKTSGNPFFIKQFMQSLYDDGHLHLDGDKGAWCWDLYRVRAVEAAGNVVSLMIHQFGRLPEPSRGLLRLAACIGGRFDLALLSIIGGKGPLETFQHLRIPVEKGYLLPLDEGYKLLWANRAPNGKVNAEFRFAHDKIQQAAYDLIPEEERNRIHLTIGTLLLENLGGRKLEKRLFDVTDQLNRAKDLITDNGKRAELAGLNLDAALKAKASAAYRPAAAYLEKGCSLLGENAWKTHYSLCYALHRERAEVTYLAGSFETARKLIGKLMERADSNMEKAEVLNLLIVQETMSARYEDALSAGRKALLHLGIDLPGENPSDLFERELERVRMNMGDRSAGDLLNLPCLTDRSELRKLRLLTDLCSPAYRWDQALFRILVLKAVNISLTSGLAAESCYTFSAYGLLLGSLLGDYHTGHGFGMLALSIAEKFDNPTQKCRAAFVLSSTLIHWVRHARQADPVSDQCYRVGLDSGEFQFAGYIRTYKLTNRIFQGHPLPALKESCDRYLDFSRKTGNRWAEDVIRGTRRVLSWLTVPCSPPGDYREKDRDARAFVDTCLTNKSHSALCRFHIFHSLALYLLGETEAARKASKEAAALSDYLFGTVYAAEQVFFESLILLRLIPTAENAAGRRWFTQVRENQKKLKAWTDACPENFEHRYLIVEAEIFRVLGEDLKAMEMYDEAIESARANGYVQNEALANECAALFWTARNKPRFAEGYLRDAFAGYRRWGAEAKLALMKAARPDLFQERVQALPSPPLFEDRPLSPDRKELDTIVKALQAISGEIVLEKLLTRLMNFVVREQGADRGTLFLVKSTGLHLAAELDTQRGGEASLYAVPLEESRCPLSVIRYTARTLKTVVVGTTADAPLFEGDPYILEERPKSMLCMPVLRRGELKAVLYMENRVVAGAFTPKRLDILGLLSAQAAISLENAVLFHERNREITERKRVEKALRRSKERFRDLADLLPQMIFEIDTAGTFTYLNRNGMDALGITEKMLSGGISIREVMSPEHHPALERNIRNILDGQTPSGNPYTLMGKREKSIPVIAYSNRILHEGEITGIRGIVVDITDLKRTENQLTSTRDYLSRLFNTLPSILLSVDQEGTILQWNRAAEAFTDRSAGNAVGRVIWDHMPFLVQYREALKGMLESGEPVQLYRRRLETFGKRFFDIFFYPLIQEETKGAVIRIDDVTDPVNKDHQLQQAQKMETIGNLAGGLAHDFNNLLAGITGTLSLIRLKLSMKKPFSPEKFTGYIGTIETATMRAVNLVKQLQTLSRQKELELSLFDLSSAAKNVMGICRHTIDKSITIRERYADGPALVEADPARIEQVLLNICINAAHSMTIMREKGEPQGGTLTISVDRDSRGRIPLAPRPGEQQGPFRLIRVKDTGVGMTPQVIARIFDPFFTTKESGTGTGLGLAMAYKIIEDHQGHIEVHSSPGRGTTFSIFLPATAAQRAEEGPETGTAEPSGASGLILVIDDEKIIRDTASRILEEAGYDVLTASGGDGGLALFRENRDRIDGVLLDMAMPGKSGREVYLAMKEMDPAVRVLLSSGFRQDKRVQEAMELGVDDFIQKPYSMAELVESMEKVIGG